MYYLYDQNTGNYLGTSDTQTANSTITAPPSGTIEATWTGNRWKDILIRVPDNSVADQMIAKVGVDIAQTQQMIAKLATIIKPQGGQMNE